MLHHVTPIEALPLFPVLDEKLLTLLRNLTPEEWEKKTIYRDWTVKNMAALLLDGNLSALSVVRDGYYEEKPEGIKTYQDLMAYLNELNEKWILASRRLSPALITELLEQTGKEYYKVLQTLDPWEDAVYSVAWAGEEISKNWFYIACAYTEKWIRQQLIRHALNRQEIMTREFFYPFLDTFMCTLPQTYRYADATVGTSVMVRVTTDLGGEWHINKTEEGWVLRHTTRVEPLSIVEMDPDTVWKLFSKCMTPAEALEKVKISGAQELGKIALGMVSVIA